MPIQSIEHAAPGRSVPVVGSAGFAVIEEFAHYLAQRFEAPAVVVVSRDGDLPGLPPPQGLSRLSVSGAGVASSRRIAGEMPPSAFVLAVTNEDPPDAVGTDLDELGALLTNARGAVLVVAGRASERSEREWRHRLEARGLAPTFLGPAPPGTFPGTDGLVAIIERGGPVIPTPAPPGFRVVAFMRTYNEEDVIHHSIRALVEQGIDVYMLDGWSTDATVERAARWLGRGLMNIERFPSEGPSRYHTQAAVLRRIERLATEIPASWFIVHDADERRMSPWTGISLRDALYGVERSGFNCIDHTLIEFVPTSDAFDAEEDFAAQLTRYRFPSPASFLHRKGWKNAGRAVALADSSGHDVTFEGRRIFPYKFLLRHYPFRTPAHAERKIFRDRRPRLVSSEAARGWGVHYLRYTGTSLAGPADLEVYDEPTFNRELLIERLSGIGMYRRTHRPGAPGHLDVKSSPCTWAAASIDVALVEPPRLDPASPAPARVLVSWDSGPISPAVVYVARPTPPETLFAAITAGKQEAAWIEPGVTYRFRLYAGTRRDALLAEVEITYRS